MTTSSRGAWAVARAEAGCREGFPEVPVKVDSGMRLCFSSLGCPEDSPDAMIARAASSGIPFIEIRTLDGFVDYPDVLSKTPGAVDSLSRALEASGVRLRLLASSFSLTGSTEAEIGGLVAVGRVADALGVPFLRVFGGGREGLSMSRAESLAAAELFLRLSEAWERAEIRSRLLVETHGGLVTPGAIESFENATGGSAEYLWDSHHTWKLGGTTPGSTTAQIGAKIRHIHCKDSIPDPGSSHGYRYVPPGAGDFPFGDLLESMSRLGEEAVLSLEWERKWHPGLPPLDEALASFLGVVRCPPQLPH